MNQKVALMNLRKITPKLLCIFLSFLILNNSKAQNSIDDVGQINAINTAVPFLRIIPDARAGGMGDVGIASSADAGGTYFNNSKLVFAPKKLGINLSYTPWLRNLGITDIYLAHFSGYYQLDKNQVISTSLKFFSLGNITFTDFQGNITGDFRPREMALDVGYARKLGKYYSLGIQLRYIYSNLASGQTVDGVPIKAGNAFGSDITMSYFKPIKLKKMNSQLNVGLAITNLGSKISYSSDALNQDYIPTNAGLGLGYKEEMREFNYSIGVEYWYDKQFAVRAGYFLENKLKGNRKFFTAGLSAKYSVFGLDFSYLVPTSNQRSPLDNTFRFTLSFNFDKLGKKDKSSESGSEVMPTPVEE